MSVPALLLTGSFLLAAGVPLTNERVPPPSLSASPFGTVEEVSIAAPLFRSVPGDASARRTYSRVLLVSDPGARTVALALRFPAGSATDPVGGEGRAFLFSRVVEVSANQRLATHRARVRVEVGPDELLLTLLVSPERWTEALREVESALFTETLSQARLEDARDTLLQVLRFEEGSPGRAFDRELAFMLLGSTHPAARPRRGSPGTLPGIGLDDLHAYRSEHLSQDRGALVVTGPLNDSEVRGALSGPVEVVSFGRREDPPPQSLDAPFPDDGVDRSAPPAPGVAAEPGAFPPPPLSRIPSRDLPEFGIPPVGTGTLAWESADRTVLDRAVTATWMATAFPFPSGTPNLLLDFLAHLVMENLNRSPPDPGLYESAVAVEVIRGAPVIVVSASVDPFRSAEWEARLAASFDSLAEAPPLGAFFELTRRRFRSTLLMDLAAPEQFVRWLARRSEAGPEHLADPELELWRLTPEGVSDAARRAGAPRSILYGPQGLPAR